MPAAWLLPNATDASNAQMAVGAMKGFSTLLNDQLLGLLEQDLDFGGMIGGIIGVSILNLPVETRHRSIRGLVCGDFAWNGHCCKNADRHRAIGLPLHS